MEDDLHAQVQFWKTMARKHERRSKQATRLVRELIQRLQAQDAQSYSDAEEIAQQIERLYEAKRAAQTGIGEPFIRSRPTDGTQEIIVTRSRSRPMAPPAKIRGGQ